MGSRTEQLKEKASALRTTINLYERQQAEGYDKLKRKFGCNSIPEAIAKAEGINQQIEEFKASRDENLNKAEEYLDKIGTL